MFFAIVERKKLQFYTKKKRQFFGLFYIFAYLVTQFMISEKN